MTPAFGFSVGDFISTINLIRKISKALKETGGASSEYQDAVLELNGLKHVLQHVEALEPTEDNLGHVNAIRGMALACRPPLQEFLKELDKYEGSLGPWPRRSSVRDFGRKARWAVSFGKEVDKLRAIVVAKQISINLLLATHSSQTLSSLHHRTKQEYNASKARHEEHRAALDRVWGTAQNFKDAMDSTADETKAGLQTLSNRIDSSNTSIASLTSIGNQILAFLKTFPQKVRERLRDITQADLRTYQAVLRLQESISRAPTCLYESNIQFTNALGEHRSLPYEYFRDWEPFEGLLRAQFKDKPGEMKILNGSFHIMDSKRGSIVKKDHWHRNISQGIHLKMSMIMLHLRTSSGKCPQPDCAGVGRVSSNDPLQLMCDTCYLAFFPETTELEDAFGKAKVSDEAVTRQQVEEDMRLYGTRPEPSDVVSIHDNHENIRQKEPLLKRDASHVEATTGRPAKMPRLFEDAGPESQVLTAMDWHSGASPLEAWLNQSAIPTIAANQGDNQPATSVESQIAQEIEEIKTFRSVHLMAVQQPSSLHGSLTLDKDFASLRHGAQIYYRNIKDKFALIPSYLARRLAEANLDRATALRTRKYARDGARLPLLDGSSAFRIQQSAINPGASTSRALPNVPNALSARLKPPSDLRHSKDKRFRIACFNCRRRK
ncbi:MAG: hypothetical protein LQ349_008637, partial [Xanthoria aureola]